MLLFLNISTQLHAGQILTGSQGEKKGSGTSVVGKEGGKE